MFTHPRKQSLAAADMEVQFLARRIDPERPKLAFQMRGAKARELTAQTIGRREQRHELALDSDPAAFRQFSLCVGAEPEQVCRRIIDASGEKAHVFAAALRCLLVACGRQVG